jgi:hypothetical protein
MEAPAYPGIVLAGNRSATRNSGLGLAIGLSLLVVGALWFGGQGQLLRMALPAMAMLVAVVLYASRPILYVRYSLWVWFLAPLARRIVDWRFGYTDPNVVLLAPFLVAGIAGLTLLRPSQRTNTRIPDGFVLCGTAILYGFIVGLVLRPSAETVFGLLNWSCPMLFGLHLYLNWRHYEQHREAISKSFLQGVLVLGLYGIYQFFLPPGWDRYWLENASLNSLNPSFGQPESLLVRVWSSMNSPGPFANTMMVGLLLLFIIRSPLRLPAAVAGYLSFLLSAVRTAWLSWIIGLMLVLKSARPRIVVRVSLSIILLLACLLPALSDPRLASVIGDRVKTFTDLGHDESFGARTEMYRVLVNDALSNPFGHGLKNLEIAHGIAVDSGILILVFSLGWFGSAFFAAGVLSFFLQKEHPQEKSDEFSRAGKAVMIAILAQLVSGNIFVNVTGAMFWIFAGMYLGARRYYENEQQACSVLA